MRIAILLLFTLEACTGGACAGPGRLAPRAGEVECAPFARSITGVRLAGAAADWWAQAAGRYGRTHVPRPGSLLVFARNARLPSGHVAVVSAVVSAREVLLTQANWVHGQIGIDQPARDVSPDNGWGAVRVWWPPAGGLGVTTYQTEGFIVPDRSFTRATIDAAAAAR